MRGWADTWATSLGRLIEVGAGYELCSLVTARWEFLGSLLTGYARRRSDRTQALAYARRFLEKRNPRYGARHPAVSVKATVADLLFRMLRNGSLHGFTPSPVFDPLTDQCVTWWATATGLKATHLQFAETALHVDGQTLRDELVESMRDFATYLEANQKTERGTRPRDDFRIGCWWRLAPQVPRDFEPFWPVETP
jgi:hypothetical protein